ncbi:DNA polymerase III subunit gamma/tau [Kroppenstedtia guangzhouensis]|uniref:DNA polymerase III subunit gamma/tau n=1 Tax=Kroppenstedtia guangzhouensis TaxID=1274356 RepID=UPI00166A7AC0|nr:DNA polymerase III subunit gamma/tau [Kroppenstedtia guangzhouensis]
MSYRALYRVWRPQKFEDLIGQEHVTTTLKNALTEGHFSHAYLFSGPRGTGKTSAAKILAKAVNCRQGPAPEPCNECDACRKITEGSLMDVVEIDAASNRGVDEIRDLRDKVKYAPSEVRCKVYIVDEVHMLTAEAFNALLKTLEEPPGHAIFILATTEPHKLPSTIISRCQRFSFRRHTLGNTLGHLRKICDSQGIEVEDSALAVIAQAADGGMRDALSLLDQVLAFSDDCVDEAAVLSVTGSVSRSTLGDLMEACLGRDAGTALEKVEELLADGLDPERLVHDLVQLSRDLLLLAAAPELKEVKERLAGEERWNQLVEKGSIEELEGVLEILIQAQQQMKWAPHPRVLLEMALVRICHHFETPSPQGSGDADLISSLREQLKQLEQKVEELSGLASSPPAAEPAAPFPVRRESAAGSEERTGRRNLGPARLAPLLKEASTGALQRLQRAWPEVLARVKERKITVHAWLIDGEPVAATEDTLLVAFKNNIHRETTEKDSNKKLIEQVMKEVFGSTIRLMTVMREDWEKERMTSGPPSVTGRDTGGRRVPPKEVPQSDDPVERAVEMFGRDMVEITD